MVRGSSWFGRPFTVGAAFAVAAAAGLYGGLQAWGNRAPAACAASAALAPEISRLARGEVAAFEVAKIVSPAPDLAFADPDGRRRRLADFSGRTVLLNLWATWCEPCKREMPALDRLQGELGGPGFEVVTVNIDTRDFDKPARWLRDAGIARLASYSDREARIFQDLRRIGETEGLPTTLLVGRDGCKIGRLAGWAEWASPDGIALVRAALGTPAGGTRP